MPTAALINVPNTKVKNVLFFTNIELGSPFVLEYSFSDPTDFCEPFALLKLLPEEFEAFDERIRIAYSSIGRYPSVEQRIYFPYCEQ